MGTPTCTRQAVRAVVTAFLFVAITSCGDTTGPDAGGRLALGQPVTGQVGGDTVRTYEFLAAAGGEYRVELQALEGGVELVIVDSASQQQVNQLWAHPVQFPTMSTVIASRDGGVYQLRLRSTPPGSGQVRFLFQVNARSTVPELRPGAFAVGDTVSGETMASADDVDQFSMSATAGDEIVAVAEGLAGATGMMRLRLLDAPAGTALPTWYWVGGGGPTPVTTGAVLVPATGRLVFRFESESGQPAFAGAYRFWTYRIGRAPEQSAALLPASTVVRERIERAGDIDEFTFQAAAGAEYSAFIESGREFTLQVAPQGGTPVAGAVDHVAGDTSLFSVSTGPFQVSQAGTWVVRVSGSEAIADTGAYRIYLHPVDRRPESVPQVLVVGDTVTGEAISMPGDVDEFTFTATAGEEYNAFIQSLDTGATARLRLDVLEVNGTVKATAYSDESDTTLLDQPSGRFTVLATVPQRLRVSGLPLGSYAYARGRYRLFLQRVVRAPEVRPPVIGAGDSVIAEALDLPGDIDEFQFTVTDTVSVVLGIEILPGGAGSGGMEAQLNSGTTTLLRADVFGPGRAAESPYLLAPGSYTVRVGGGYYLDPPATQRGPYRLWLFRSLLRPESAIATVAIGDTVSGERIERVGDRDEFVFQGRRGEHINVMLQGLGAAANARFGAFLWGPLWGGVHPLLNVTAPLSSASMADHQSTRFDLPATGQYRLVLSVDYASDPFLGTGDYRFAIARADTAPEHVPGMLAPGDSVTGESTDTPGDLDAFLVTAVPGQTLHLIMDATPVAGRFPGVWAFDAATGDTLASAPGYGLQLSGPFRVPASGQVLLELGEMPPGSFRFCYDASCQGLYTFTGPYRFHVVAVDRAPENVAGAFVVGDTVRGEVLLPSLDMDEFSSTGTPGDTLSAWYRLLAAPQPAGTMIALEVIDPATGARLAGGMALTGTTPGHVRVGVFAVPPSGAFLVRVRGGLTFYDLGTAPYEFFVKRGP